MVFRLLLLLSLAVSPAAAQTIEVALTAELPPDSQLGLRGNTDPLSWEESLLMTDPDGDGTYTATLTFPPAAGTVEYKAAVTAADGTLSWESGANRLLIPGRMTVERRALNGPQTDLPILEISAEELRADAELLWSALGAVHPGMSLHNSGAELSQIKANLDQQVGDLITKFGELIPLPQAYLVFARTVASIKDGHTQVSMYNQGGYLTSILYTRSDRAPFSFQIVSERMIVTGDATPGKSLPQGTEVLSMDGMPIPDILADLRPFASADGSNDAKRTEELEVSGVLAPAERFDVIYSLLFEPVGELKLSVRRPGESSVNLTVPRLTQAERTEILSNRDRSLPRSNGDLLRSRMLDDSTAYVYVGSFATFNMKTDYDAWVTTTFQAINASGATRLVLDLRDVAGGMDDAAALLLQHILQKPVSQEQWQGITAYDRIPEDLRPHLRSWSTGFYDLSGLVKPSGEGFFKMPSRPPVALGPARDAFKGKVAVLVDATASSATFYLAKSIKEQGIAPLVGQTTGGSLKGLNAGQMVFLTLPNTGIVVDIPLYGARPPMPGPDRGIQPDVLVPEDADGVIAGRDPELEAALRVLAGE